jgi:hypothetical protein
MAHNAIVGSVSVAQASIRAPGHDQVLRGLKMVADQDTLRAGAVISKNSSGLGVPYEDLSEVLGTGDGSTAAYTDTLEGAPLEPGSVVVDDGVEAFADDGFGTLTGDGGGSGTINYETGAISVTFDTDVVNETDVVVTSSRKVYGVLERDIDTTSMVDGVVVIHGTVKESALTKNTTPEACEAADFERLLNRGVYPV